MKKFVHYLLRTIHHHNLLSADSQLLLAESVGTIMIGSGNFDSTFSKIPDTEFVDVFNFFIYSHI